MKLVHDQLPTTAPDIVDVFLECSKPGETARDMKTFWDCLPGSFDIFRDELKLCSDQLDDPIASSEEKGRDSDGNLLDRERLLMTFMSRSNMVVKYSLGFTAEVDMITYIIRFASPIAAQNIDL